MYKEIICKHCGEKWKKYNSLQKCICQTKPIEFKPRSPIAKKQYTIPKKSKKRAIEEAKYIVLRIEFLSKKENQICPITKQPTTDIHHKRGRIGNLLLDTRYWVALSREGHKYVEEHPDWAKQNGFSLDRLTI